MEKVSKLKEALNNFETPFKFSIDRFRGVKIDENSLPSTAEEFKEQFELLYEEIETHGGRAIWLWIPIEKWFIIEIAASQGFSFHHTRGKLLMMTKWLDKERENKLPSFATHYCGVGGFVMNELDEVLMSNLIYLIWNLPQFTA